MKLVKKHKNRWEFKIDDEDSPRAVKMANENGIIEVSITLIPSKYVYEDKDPFSGYSRNRWIYNL